MRMLNRCTIHTILDLLETPVPFGSVLLQLIVASHVLEPQLEMDFLACESALAAAEADVLQVSIRWVRIKNPGSLLGTVSC